MKRTATIHVLAVLAVLTAAGDRIAGQTPAEDAASLRLRLEQRFEILPLRDGAALRPHETSRGVRSIEVTDGPIAIDGQPATGAELREKLGAEDAALVLELSYLSAAARRTIVQTPPPTTPSVTPLPEPPDSDSSRPPRRRGYGRRDDMVRIGPPITIREGEVVDGDVVGIGGGVSVDGEVHGDVVSIGGPLRLGPHASISENVVAVGGGLRRDPAARVGGRIQEVGFGGLDFSNWRGGFNPLMLWWGSMVGSAVAFVGTLARLCILCLLAALVILFGRSYVERAGDRATSETLKSGAIGLLAQLLFIPVLVLTIVLLVVTIIGIPLLLLIPFLLLGLAIVGLVGFTGVAYRLGALVSTRFGWATANPYATTIVGIVALLSPLLLARVVGLGGVVMVPFTFGLGMVGWLVEYLAWTVGFGAMALARFNRRSAAPMESLAPST